MAEPEGGRDRRSPPPSSPVLSRRFFRGLREPSLHTWNDIKRPFSRQDSTPEVLLLEKISNEAHIPKLPAELQLMVIDHLSFVDIRRLRQTCIYFHTLLSPPVISRRFGGRDRFRRELDRYCRVCEVTIQSWMFRVDYYSDELYRATCWSCLQATTICRWCGGSVRRWDREPHYHDDVCGFPFWFFWILVLLSVANILLLAGEVFLARRDHNHVLAIGGPVISSG